jgi:hypothetical protein
VIEALSLQNASSRLGDRVASSGLSLGAVERPGPSAGAPVPATSPASQSNPFDRRDIFEIRGNVRPLAAEASVALGASDEEGGGAPESGGESSGRSARAPRTEAGGASALLRQALVAYGQAPLASVLTASPSAGSAPERSQGEGPAVARRGRQLREAFREREPEDHLGRLFDVAA